MRRVFNNIDENIVIVNKNGIIKFCNESLLLNLGYTEEEIINKDFNSILYDTKLIDIISSTDIYQDNILKFKFISKFNKVLKVVGTIHLELFEGNELYVIVSKDSDINSSIKNKEIETQGLIDNLTSMSHEFKTPLNIILATIQLIDKKIENNNMQINDNIDLKRHMNFIKQNSYRLLRLISNITDRNKIDNGFYTIYLKNYNIVEIVEDITMSVAQYVENKGIELIFDTEIEEEVICCDPDKIERIMLNLLSNAIKYTTEEGKIKVTVKLNDNNVEISVKDNGVGIPKNKLNNIFNKFIQVDNNLTRVNRGSGIGLSLVKSFVEMHDGTIEVYSEVGEGAEFVFNLPRLKVAEEDGINTRENINSLYVEKFNIEFSDIYDLN